MLLPLAIASVALLQFVGANNDSNSQFWNDWHCGRVPPPACPDDHGPPGSFGLGDLVCSALACKRTPGWIATRPCNTHLIGGIGQNGTCSYAALGADGNTTLVACGSSPLFQGGRVCICTNAASVPCQCTYALRFAPGSPNCGPLDSFNESSNYNATVIAFRACDSPFQPNATYTTSPPHTAPPMSPPTHQSGTLNGGARRAEKSVAHARFWRC